LTRPVGHLVSEIALKLCPAQHLICKLSLTLDDLGGTVDH
jgi:hypothetical protein